MVSKTRDRLIEVAKQLFTYKGVENTTMNDIAAASEKGRRTIYTYFKNKREIYNAVVEQQGKHLAERLQTIVDNDSRCASEKLRMFLLELFETLIQSTPKPEGYRRLLSRDHKRVAKIYKVALETERALLLEVLKQGMESGEFDPRQAMRLPAVMEFAVGSSFEMHSDPNSAETQERIKQRIEDLTEFVVRGVISANPMNQSNDKEQ